MFHDSIAKLLSSKVTKLHDFLALIVRLATGVM